MAYATGRGNRELRYRTSELRHIYARTFLIAAGSVLRGGEDLALGVSGTAFHGLAFHNSCPVGQDNFTKAVRRRRRPGTCPRPRPAHARSGSTTRARNR